MIDYIKMDNNYTAGGQEVRLLCTDGNTGVYPVVGLVDGHVHKWRINGSYHEHIPDHTMDLIEVKPRIKRTVYVNLFYNHYSDALHGSEQAAEDASMRHKENRIACIKVEIDCAEGEGLS